MPARPQPPAGRRPPRGLARAAANPRLAWAVALALAVALAVVALLATPLALEARDRDQVRDVAAAMASRLTTFESGALDRWVEGVQELSTPDYAAEVEGLLDAQVRDELAAAEVTSNGQVADVFVQRVDGREASAFAVVRQVTTSAALDEPASGEVRMTLSLRRVGAGWRVDGITVLAGGRAGLPVPAPGGAP